MKNMLFIFNQYYLALTAELLLEAKQKVLTSVKDSGKLYNLSVLSLSIPDCTGDIIYDLLVVVSAVTVVAGVGAFLFWLNIPPTSTANTILVDEITNIPPTIIDIPLISLEHINANVSLPIDANIFLPLDFSLFLNMPLNMLAVLFNTSDWVFIQGFSLMVGIPILTIYLETKFLMWLTTPVGVVNDPLSADVPIIMPVSIIMPVPIDGVVPLPNFEDPDNSWRKFFNYIKNGLSNFVFNQLPNLFTSGGCLILIMFLIYLLVLFSAFNFGMDWSAILYYWEKELYYWLMDLFKIW